MPLPDSATNAGTPMPKNIGAYEGEQIIQKLERFEKARKPGIMTGTGIKKGNHKIFYKLLLHFY
jgi:hypothetical protein